MDGFVNFLKNAFGLFENIEIFGIKFYYFIALCFIVILAVKFLGGKE